MTKKEKVSSFIGNVIAAVGIGLICAFLASAAVLMILWTWVLIGQLIQELTS